MGFKSALGKTAKIVGQGVKTAAKEAAPPVGAILKDSGAQIGDEAMRAFEQIMTQATDRICTEIATQTNRILDRIEQHRQEDDDRDGRQDGYTMRQPTKHPADDS